MTPQQTEAMERFGEAYRAVQRMGPAFGALEDVKALHLTAECVYLLRQLYAHLEAQEKGDGIRFDP